MRPEMSLSYWIQSVLSSVYLTGKFWLTRGEFARYEYVALFVPSPTVPKREAES